MKDFLKFVAAIFEMPEDELSLDTAYRSVAIWDSLMQLRLVNEIEDAFGVEIPINKVGELKTLNDFYLYISK